MSKFASGGFVEGNPDDSPMRLRLGDCLIPAASARRLSKPILDQLNARSAEDGDAS